MRMRLSLPVRAVSSRRWRVDAIRLAAAVLNATWFSVIRTGACFGSVQLGAGVMCDMAIPL